MNWSAKNKLRKSIIILEIILFFEFAALIIFITEMSKPLNISIMFGYFLPIVAVILTNSVAFKITAKLKKSLKK